MSEYIANAGQTYLPVQENINVDFTPFEHPQKPNPLLRPLELSDSYRKNGFILSHLSLCLSTVVSGRKKRLTVWQIFSLQTQSYRPYPHSPCQSVFGNAVSYIRPDTAVQTQPSHLSF